MLEALKKCVELGKPGRKPGQSEAYLGSSSGVLGSTAGYEFCIVVLE